VPPRGGIIPRIYLPGGIIPRIYLPGGIIPRIYLPGGIIPVLLTNEYDLAELCLEALIQNSIERYRKVADSDNSEQADIERHRMSQFHQALLYLKLAGEKYG